MKTKSKKSLFALLLTGCSLLGYALWLLLRPVEVVAVHNDGNHSYVLVKNFPVTEKGKINWWRENKDIMIGKYHISNPAKDGFFSVTFWDFDDGYKETDGYDRLCFNDIKSKKNCIDKNKVFSVENNRNNEILFGVEDGVFRLKKNGEMIKTKYE